MIRSNVREAAQICRQAFDFLVGEFGYRPYKDRFDSGGFTLRYLGDIVGVEVEWYPRDPLTVWIVHLVDHAFPARVLTVHPDSELNHFDLADLEEISGHVRDVPAMQLYRVPDEENARMLAQTLRTYGRDLLQGNLEQVPVLRQRILERARAGAIHRFGAEEAAKRGW